MRKSTLLYTAMLIAGTVVVSACVFMMSSEYVEINHVGNTDIINAVGTMFKRFVVFFNGHPSA